MTISVYPSKEELGRAAAEEAAQLFRETLSKQESVRFVAATGASQFDFLDNLCSAEGIDWNRTEMFHLDEYVGIDESHPASFVGYLRKRLVERVHPGKVHFIRGDAEDQEAERQRLSSLISAAPIDVAFIGIGENGHIAFNDPPADFEAEEAYLVLNLDEQCKRQQVGEGWFGGIEEVPAQAYTMSVKQILKAKQIICCVPDKRKAQAVRNCLGKEVQVTPLRPASILKTHPACHIFLDEASASQLSTGVILNNSDDH